MNPNSPDLRRPTPAAPVIRAVEAAPEQPTGPRLDVGNKYVFSRDLRVTAFDSNRPEPKPIDFRAVKGDNFTLLAIEIVPNRPTLRAYKVGEGQYFVTTPVAFAAMLMDERRVKEGGNRGKDAMDPADDKLYFRAKDTFQERVRLALANRGPDAPDVMPKALAMAEHLKEVRPTLGYPDLHVGNVLFARNQFEGRINPENKRFQVAPGTEVKILGVTKTEQKTALGETTGIEVRVLGPISFIEAGSGRQLSPVNNSFILTGEELNTSFAPDLRDAEYFTPESMTPLSAAQLLAGKRGVRKDYDDATFVDLVANAAEVVEKTDFTPPPAPRPKVYSERSPR